MNVRRWTSRRLDSNSWKVISVVARAERKNEKANVGGDRLDFESQFEKLNACVTSLESGQLSLDESLKAYRAGIELVGRCRVILEQVQARVESIDSIEENGELKSSPLNLEVESHSAFRKPGPESLSDDEPF